MIGSAWREKLILAEGNRQFVYDDATGKPIGPGTTVVGYPTIGIGRELSKTGLSKSEINMLFFNSLTEKEKQVREVVPNFDKLSEARQFVLISMAYQMGIGGLKGFPKMLAAVRRENWTVVREEMLDSKWAEQTPGRARELANLMENG